MDSGTLLAPQQVHDGRVFIQQYALDGNSIAAAFWVKTVEDETWFLYVVSDVIDDSGPAQAYRQARNTLQKLGNLWVTGADIKVISPNNPIAIDVFAIMRQHQGRTPTWIGSCRLGLVAIEQGYIYSPDIFTFTQANPMTQDEITRKILDLLKRGAGLLPPSRVTLSDGTQFDGVPYSLNMESGSLKVSFIVEREQFPRTVRIDEISSVA